MRVLLTTMPNNGHFHPLVPIARALQAAGHEVAFASAAAYVPTIEAAGLHAFAAGYDRADGRSSVERFPERHAVPPAERRAWVFRTVFAGFEARQRVPDLLAIAEAWRPDLIVRDAIEFGGCIAAEVLGLPHAAVRSATWYYRDRHWVAAVLDELRAAHGLPPDPDAAMLYRYLFLAAEPPGFQPPGEPLPPTTHLLRPEVADGVASEPPAWLGELPSQPTVYATLGTAWRLHGDALSS